MKELLLILKKFFGYDSFRPMQEQIIRHILQKRDALVLMPTGGGKSLCFQLPAIYLPGTALVVSPLIALMQDQVEALTGNGVPAAALNSLMPEEEKQRVKQGCIQGKIKLLYISPEGLMNEMDWLLPRMEISLIAIDEAHCISHWGHDFRPEYTQLAVLKERFPSLPIVALTATADKLTRMDIVQQLKLNDPQLFLSSFDRPNLSLTVRRGLSGREKLKHSIQFIRRRTGQSGIIYCMRRKDTEAVAAALAACGIRATAYHAGLDYLSRQIAQEEFLHDRTTVICATVAFGMGIDKSNVRWVIHYNMPSSIENYYQEIGRAGRDGLPADTLLFYSLNDLTLLRRFAEESGQERVNSEKLDRMQRYCEANICRRRTLLSYFNEESNRDCGNCDVCRQPPERFEATIIAQKVLSAVVRSGETVGINLVIDILRASVREEVIRRGFDKIKTYGAGRDLPYTEWKEYIYQLIQLGYLELDYTMNNRLKVTALGNRVLFDNERVALAKYIAPEKQPEAVHGHRGFKAKPIRIHAKEQLADALYDSLKQLRLQIAAKERVAPYIIFSDDSLVDMVKKRPTTAEEFSEIRGVGLKKQQKYATVFVALIRFVLENHQGE